MRHKIALAVMTASCGIGESTLAAFTPVFGSPVHRDSYPASPPFVGNGVASEYISSEYSRSVRWDATGNVTPLDPLGRTSGGPGTAYVLAMNAAGTAVGTSDKIVDAVNYGRRGVLWNAGSGTAVELAGLDNEPTGMNSTSAVAINASGECVGMARYSGSEVGVRWDAAGRVTRLQSLAGLYTNPVDINDNGVSCGNTVTSTGPARWRADGTIQLLNPVSGNDRNGTAIAINNAGTVIGTASKASGFNYSLAVPVRWDAGSTTPVELRPLAGDATATLTAINDSGVIIGGSTTAYSTSGNSTSRSVRWEPGATEPVVITSPGRAAGYGAAGASAINNLGWMAGAADRYVSIPGTPIVSHAVVWDANGVIMDLNDLIDPASGWTLLSATAISDTNWVSGFGTFKSGNVTSERAFLIQVPEPSSLALMSIGLAVLHRRHRKAFTQVRTVAQR